VIAPLHRRLLAEFLGTGMLVTVVVGSGIAAQTLSRDVGLELFENAAVTAAGLAVLILMFGPVSGAHFNPIVTLADWWLGRRTHTGVDARTAAAYVVGQVAGGISGAVLADAMFGWPLVSWSQHTRTGGHLWLGEVVATAGLLLLIVSLARTGDGRSTPWAVGAYIGAAYWFTSSTSFANPAVTVARSFTDSFAGIAPSSTPGFLGAQIVGGLVGLGLVVALYPDAPAIADEIVVPHHAPNATAGSSS
jgi:glycerol uptake facilitator-like aquaporin